jgi:hypothetical protein
MVLAAADPQPAIEVLRQVGPEGRGNEQATAAWRTLAVGESSHLLTVLKSLDGANPLAQNWLRAAADSMADRAVKQGRPLPVAELTAFLRDSTHDGSARLLAWNLIREADAAKADSFTTAFLDDRAAELRRPGVSKLIAEAKALQSGASKDAAIALFEKAFTHARDQDQITATVDALKELGRAPNIVAQLGLLVDWDLIAPFSNGGRSGFEKIFPPEVEIKTDATYDGPDGQKISWKPFHSKDEYGQIDFNKPFGLTKEVVGYATTTFNSPAERSAEIRIGTGNAWKIWLNGRFVFGRDEYHRGAMLDQYILPIQLRKGPNTLLVKCCQNEQKETWTVEWRFQLRICDHTGSAIHQAAD